MHPGRDPTTQSPIRVLAANLPEGLYQTLSGALQGQPDLLLLGHAHDRLELLISLDERVDVLLLGAQQLRPPPGICTHLLSEFADLKIVVLTPKGDQAMLYWRGLGWRELARLSAEELVVQIRQAHSMNPVE